MASVASTHVPSASKWCRGTCRCEACHEARKLYNRQWLALKTIKAGREPASRVPTQGAKMHVRMLERSGMSHRQIALAAGVSPGCLCRMMKPGTNASAITVRRVFSVEP